MENLSEIIVKTLKNKNETISFMESCTGGFLANEITNIDGSSNVLKVSLVTYSSEYKIKFGVDENVINTKGVYSNFTSQEMAEKISGFAGSNWGIGITGELGNVGTDRCVGPAANIVYYSIYNSNTQKTLSNSIIAKGKTREERKKFVAEEIFGELCRIIKN